MSEEIEQAADEAPAEENPVEKMETLFDDVSDSGTQEEGEDSNLIFGKYKTIDDAENGYKELTKKLRDKAPETPQPTDDNQFGYDFEEAFTNSGLNMMPLKDEDGKEITENKEVYETFFNQVREAGFSQSQFEFMTSIGGEWLSQQLSNLGPEVDLVGERNKLKDDLGLEYENRMQSVSQWANANLSADVYSKPLNQTAAGFRLLENLKNAERGKTPIIEQPATTVLDTMEINKELETIMNSPEYTAMTHGSNPLHARVKELMTELHSQKKRQ